MNRDFWPRELSLGDSANPYIYLFLGVVFKSHLASEHGPQAGRASLINPGGRASLSPALTLHGEGRSRIARAPLETLP